MLFLTFYTKEGKPSAFLINLVVVWGWEAPGEVSADAVVHIVLAD